VAVESNGRLMYRIIKSYDSKDEKASNSELLTEQQFHLRCEIQTGEIIRQQKNVQEFPNESLNISRVSELTNGVENDLRHRLRWSNAVYHAYRTALDDTAGVPTVAQLAMSV